MLSGLALLWYLMFELIQYRAVAGGSPTPVKLFPVPEMVWYTVGCVIFAVGLGWLLAPRARPQPLVNDLGIRRAAIAAVVLAYGFEFAARTYAARLGAVVPLAGPGIFVMLVAGGVMLTVLMWRPPTVPVLVALLLIAGVAIRLLWIARVPLDASYADNLVVVQRGLERLLAGAMPYTHFHFRTHSQPLPYLPWTVLSYLPPFVAGVDVRVTNIILSTALPLSVMGIMRSLGTEMTIRRGLCLALAVFFVLPIAIGHDAHATWSLFNLMVVLGFGLVALGRVRWAAISFGIALGAQTVGLYLIVPVTVFLIRRGPWRTTVLSLAVMAALAAGPLLAFVVWDARELISALTAVPRRFWQALDDGSWTSSPFAIVAWYAVFGGALRLVQVGLFLGFAVVAWLRQRTVHDMLALASGGYVALVFAGPYIAPHMFALPLYLAVLAEGIHAAPVESRRADEVVGASRARSLVGAKA